MAALQGPEDPTDLDFTGLASASAPKAKAAPVTDKLRSQGLIGESALKSSGYHVVIARPHKRPDPTNNRILIVEDDEDTAELAARALRKGGFVTSRAVTAKETAHFLGRVGIPALILLDVELPGLDGFEMLARLRGHPKLGALPIVMFTGRSSSEDVVRGLTLGADGYVAKPATPKTLLEVVQRVLGP
jgi:CheY-like chemotaxis protein